MSDVRSTVENLAQRFARAGIASPVADAELLVGAVCGWSRGDVLTRAFMGTELSEPQTATIEAWAARRENREPLQHITGMAPFRSLLLHVGPGALVPRPETELVAEWAIEALRQVPSAAPRAVDLGTGTGALALALATEVPHALVWAVELSDEARVWAGRNIAEFGDDRVTLVAADATTALPELDGTIDVVVTNPPYLRESDVPTDPEVSVHDPSLALYGGRDGLRDVRSFTARAFALLRPGGTLVLEHGDDQSADAVAIAREAGFRMVTAHTDLLHRERAISAVK
ncbi:release factor glutamine methyltransferase [Microbacteriaceae bacterium MWH-Ta3]|nr:release factor glutamine methyltransferase [Microbacteriaceae bacterium MWH-Ta3]